MVWIHNALYVIDAHVINENEMIYEGYLINTLTGKILAAFNFDGL